MHFLEPLISEWQLLVAGPQTLHTILFWIFAVALLVQLLYYWTTFVRLAAHKPKPLSLLKPKEPVSVIIAARDEYLNLYENLPAVLEQDYPDFEVIVVNNESTDDSATLLKNFQLQYPHLKVITLERNLNFFKGKKFPLALGIRAAKHDILIFTDADCKPASPEWLNHMQTCYDPETGVVLGVGQYQRRKGLLNMLIRYETFFIAAQYLSFALAGMPYMGVGRNLSYRKSIFLRQKGFIAHYNVSSGDDDLFVNAAAGTTGIRIQVHPDAHTYSRPPSSLKRYFIQKRRHLTTGKHYKPAHKFVLGLLGFSQLLFFAMLAVVLSLQYFLIFPLAGLTLRWITQCIILKKSAKKLRIKYLCLLSPLIELFLMMFQLTVATVNLFSKPKKWK
ncbi:MAG: glycosyltransferase [Bacteroidales bacterium]